MVHKLHGYCPLYCDGVEWKLLEPIGLEPNWCVRMHAHIVWVQDALGESQLPPPPLSLVIHLGNDKTDPCTGCLNNVLMLN
jgi:hypothetical protein